MSSARVEPLIVPEERAFIEGRVRPVVPESGAVVGSVTGSGVEPLIVPEEQAFIDGEVAAPGIDWCVTHDPC